MDQPSSLSARPPAAPRPTPEFEFLREGVRRALARESLPTPSIPALNWHHVLWLGRLHGVLAFVRETVAHSPESACPAGVRAQLRDFDQAARLQSLARAGELLRLHSAFAAAGLTFVPIDDWTLHQAHGPRAIALEATGTIACLVPPADAARARACLLSAGNEVATEVFHVGTRGRPPVAIVPAPDTIDLWPESLERLDLPLGGRPLWRLPAAAWLEVRARRFTPGTPLTLLAAWGAAVLSSRAAAGGGDREPEKRLVAAADSLLGVAGSSTPPEAEAPLGRAGRAAEASPAALPPAPFVPTPPAVVKRMLALAQTTAADTVYDLGCGDGPLVIAAARRFGARAVGIDLDPALLEAAAAEAERQGVRDRIDFVCQDLFLTDLRPATVICLYVLPSFLPRLRPRLAAGAQAGVRVVSHDYPIPGWTPEATEIVRTGPADFAQIYLYRGTQGA